MPTKRPLRTDLGVIERVVSVLAKELAQWSEPSKAHLAAEYIRDAYDLLNSSLDHNDGYTAARFLERYHHYDPNSELVAILDNIPHWIDKAHDALVSEWVQREGITIPREYINQRVRFRTHGDKSFSHEGLIYEYNPERATVSIFCKEMGHVAQGLGTHGIIINLEDVEPLPDKPLWPEELAF